MSGFTGRQSTAARRATFTGALGRDDSLVPCPLSLGSTASIAPGDSQCIGSVIKGPEKPNYEEICQQGLTLNLGFPKLTGAWDIVFHSSYITIL